MGHDGVVDDAGVGDDDAEAKTRDEYVGVWAATRSRRGFGFPLLAVLPQIGLGLGL